MTPTCDCHGQPKRWQADHRRKAGGYWICPVNKRASDRRHYWAHVEQERERARERNRPYFRQRYDNDPIWRIERNLKRARELRAETIARRRQQLEEE